MLAFLSLRSRDVFVHNVFSRLFIVDDTLKTARQLIARYERDPNSIPRIRHTLSETSKDIILLEEVLMYLQESLEQDTSIYAEPADESGYKLYQVLKVKTMLDDLRIRVVDMQKVLLGARHEVNGLRAMTDTIAETQMFRLQEEIRGNSSDMLQQLKINERQSTSLDAMQVIFAGSLAFEILDRLTGEWSVVHTNWARAYIVDPFMSKPMVWFIISMMVWFGVGTGVFTLMRDLNDKTAGVITYRVQGEQEHRPQRAGRVLVAQSRRRRGRRRRRAQREPEGVLGRARPVQVGGVSAKGGDDLRRQARVPAGRVPAGHQARVKSPPSSARRRSRCASSPSCRKPA